MTSSKTISSYVVGYDLAAAYDQLTITAAGAIGATPGGIALLVQYTASVENHGTIRGGVGAAGTLSGGDAGDGVVFTVAGSLANYGFVAGGAGGSGGAGVGGGGGAGVVLEAGGTVFNSGTIDGGAGGSGAALTGTPGYGIHLTDGGVVHNYGAVAGQYAVYLDYFSGASASVTNFGAIHGSSEGVALGAAGSSIYNGAGGSIYGKFDGAHLLRAGTITNDGTITSALKSAIAIAGESGTGTITVINNGFVHGAFGITVAGTGEITNSATVTAVYTAVGDGAGTVINKATGRITGGNYGVFLYGAGTLINYGHISSSNYAVRLSKSSDRMIMEPGSTVTGSIAGGGGTLELASGTLSGALSGLGGSISGFGAYVVDAGASWRLSGANTVTSLANAGTLTLLTNTHLYVSDLGNSGIIKVTGGTGATSGLVFSGDATLSGGGTVSLNASGYISGRVAGDSLINLDNLIEGGGAIRGPLTLTNDGTIDASVGRMPINPGGTITNNGLMESTGASLMLIRDTTIDSSGGGRLIDGHRLRLDSATLKGGSLTIDKGAILLSVVHDGVVDLLGGTVQNSGFIDGAAEGLTIDGDVANSGYVQADKGSLTITGSVTGTGQARVVGGGVLTIDGDLDQNLLYTAGATGQAIVGGLFTGRIIGFAHDGSNAFDIRALPFNSADTTQYRGTTGGGTLLIFDPTGKNIIDRIKFSGNYLTSTFTLAPDGFGGTLITDPPRTTTLTAAMAAFGSAPPSPTSPSPQATAPPLLGTPH